MSAFKDYQYNTNMTTFLTPISIDLILTAVLCLSRLHLITVIIKCVYRAPFKNQKQDRKQIAIKYLKKR